MLEYRFDVCLPMTLMCRERCQQHQMRKVNRLGILALSDGRVRGRSTSHYLHEVQLDTMKEVWCVIRCPEVEGTTLSTC